MATLHDALLAAAERVLERDGLAGLTLRAVAREAGVSHAAPTHHFGDLTGLLSELAAIGFRQFNAAMIAARNSETHPLMKGLANAKAYVAYAQARPGMFSLMFRTERLDMSRPSLHEAATASFEGLASAVGAGPQREAHRGEALSLDQAAAIARAWSLVHGFTTLLLDGRLKDILHRLPEGTERRPAARCDAAFDGAATGGHELRRAARNSRRVPALSSHGKSTMRSLETCKPAQAGGKKSRHLDVGAEIDCEGACASGRASQQRGASPPRANGWQRAIGGSSKRPDACKPNQDCNAVLSNPCKSWFAARAVRRLPRPRWAAASNRHIALWRPIGRWGAIQRA